MTQAARRGARALPAAAWFAGCAFSSLALADSTTLGLADATKGTSSVPTFLRFPLTRSGDTSYDTVLGYHTVNGTAIAGTDYTAVAAGSSTLLPAAATAASIPILLNANTSSAASRQFQLQVDGATGIGAAPVFAAAAEFGTGSAPWAVTVADFNGDGRPDAAVANSGGDSVSVLFNTTAPGATTPAYAAQVELSAGSVPTAVAAADINGDGRADLLVADAGAGKMAVLLNLTPPNGGVPVFAAYQQFATGTNPSAIATADFNADGKIDAAVANGGGDTVSVLLNGTALGASLIPAFAAQQTFATGSVPAGVAARDLNGDGRPDLVVSNNGDNTLSVLLNTTAAGAATPSFAAQATFGTGAAPTSMSLADIDGDGRADAIVVDGNDNTASVLLNQTAPGAATASFAARRAFGTGVAPIAVATHDVNGDGLPDLVVANQGSAAGENSVSVLRNTTVPGAAVASFAAHVRFTAGIGPGQAAIAIADVNGDGRIDALRAGYNGLQGPSLSVLLNTTPVGAPPSNFAAQQTVVPGTNLYPRSLVNADMNGDGKLDLVTVDYGGASFSVMLNAMTPGATTAAFNVQNIATANGSFGVAAGDLNGDGKPDVVIEHPGGGITVHLNTTATGSGTMSFATGVIVSAASAVEPNGPPRLADFNGDGRLDIVFPNGHSGNGGNTTLVNTTQPGASTPSFAAQQQFAAGQVVLDGAPADINGDGLPDLISADAGNLCVNLNTTALGSTTLSFAPVVQFAAASGAGYVASADVNGDGRIDAIVSNQYAGNVSVFLNTTTPGASTPAFAAVQNFPLSDGPFALAMADVNGDGRPDIVVSNSHNLYNDTTVAVLRNTTAPGAAAPSFAAQQLYTVGARPEAVAVADINGDGRPDIMAGNAQTAAVSVLLNLQYRASVVPAAATGTIVHDYLFANGFD